MRSQIAPDILPTVKPAATPGSSALESDSTTVSQAKAIRIDATRLPDGFSATIVISSLILLGLLLVAKRFGSPAFGALSIATALTLWSAIIYLMWRHVDQHPHADFGAANTVTLGRGVVTVLFASLVPIAPQITTTWMLWSIACIATITLCMDGLDGYLARKHKQCSVFGARLDMETDALLALVITLFLWQSGACGIWILGLGLMRYGFLAAGIWIPALGGELFPSLRRKSICVIQVGALCLMLVPTLSAMQISLIGLFALVFLVYSFAVDIHWLLRQT